MPLTHEATRKEANSERYNGVQTIRCIDWWRGGFSLEVSGTMTHFRTDTE